MPYSSLTATCIYCGKTQNVDNFSDEHIWPDALGGDYLAKLWRTDDVCITCNSLSGVFVDGAFIRSWVGTTELSTGALDYISVANPGAYVLPLDYLGVLDSSAVPTDCIAELWAGPCGANIIHLRPEDEELWKAYVSGDPRAKKKHAGRAYLSFTTTSLFWVQVAGVSFIDRFKRAEKFLVNSNVPPAWQNSCKEVDLTDPTQMLDMKVVNEVTSGNHVKVKVIQRPSSDHRFLAKVALGIGYKLFGAAFLSTPYGQNLRKGFREAILKKRQKLPIYGQGFLNTGLHQVGKIFQWAGGWVLLLKVFNNNLVLQISSPSGKAAQITVCDDLSLVSTLGPEYNDGLIWLTIPTLGEAANAIPVPEYLGYLHSTLNVPELAALTSKRIDPKTLPPCG